MKRFMVYLVMVAAAASTVHAQSSGGTPHRGTTSAPAQYQLNLGETESGEFSYRADKAKFNYIRGSRYTTLSNLMPIAELNVTMLAPTQDYIYYKTYDADLLAATSVSNGIDMNPGYPSPPTPI